MASASTYFSSRWQRSKSRNERKPTSMGPSHTGKCRMPCVCIRHMAASELVLGAVACGEDADQLRAVEHRNGAHVALRHILGGLKDGLVRLDVVNGAIAQQVADGRHSALP